MEDRESAVAQTIRQIRRQVVALHGEACAEANKGEIETLAGMIERVRRLEISAFEPLDRGAGR